MSNELLGQPVEHVDILVFLRARYQEAMEAKNKELRASHGSKGGSPPVISVPQALAATNYFFNFCRSYLSRHRPAQLGHAEGNYVIILDNGEQFVIAPPIHVSRGSMQPSNSQQVTGGRYAHEVPVVPITTGSPAQQEGLDDRSAPQETRDMRADSGPIDYTQPGARRP